MSVARQSQFFLPGSNLDWSLIRVYSYKRIIQRRNGRASSPSDKNLPPYPVCGIRAGLPAGDSSVRGVVHATHEKSASAWSYHLL
jgi:hypothetical protein